MAVTVLNDLKAPVEVKGPESKTWEVVYPRWSLRLSGDEVTQVRLREEPAVQGTCERQGTLRASEDFGEVSTRGKDLDAFHERSVARERTRRSKAEERQWRQRVAREEVNTTLIFICCFAGSTLGVCPPLLVLFFSPLIRRRMQGPHWDWPFWRPSCAAASVLAFLQLEATRHSRSVP